MHLMACLLMIRVTPSVFHGGLRVVVLRSGRSHVAGWVLVVDDEFAAAERRKNGIYCEMAVLLHPLSLACLRIRQCDIAAFAIGGGAGQDQGWRCRVVGRYLRPGDDCDECHR